jgi:hypothetical protein
MGNFCNKDCIKLIYLENENDVILAKKIIFKIYYLKNIYSHCSIKDIILEELYKEYDYLILKLHTEYNKYNLSNFDLTKEEFINNSSKKYELELGKIKNTIISNKINLYIYNYYPFEEFEQIDEKTNIIEKKYVDDNKNREKIDTIIQFIENYINSNKIIDKNSYIYYSNKDIMCININYCFENRKIIIKKDKYYKMVINYITELRNDAIQTGIY